MRIDARDILAIPAQPRDCGSKCLDRAYASTAARWVAILGCAVAIIGSAQGAPYTIAKLYSDQTGSLQYVELRESSPDGVVGRLMNSVITVRHGAVVKRYVVPSDPPSGFPAGGTLLIATVADFDFGDFDMFGPHQPIPPDYVMPVRFLPTEGGTIDLDGSEPWTFASLPIDGSTALLRSGETTGAGTRSFAGGPVSFGGGFTGVLEYYNSGLDRYFLSASEPDIDAIESGRIKGWQATGKFFGAFTTTTPQCCDLHGAVPVPVCRYYIPPELGDAQFLSAFPEECQAVKANNPSFVLETSAAFYAVLPDRETGDCLLMGRPTGRPTYRLWNGGASHRFVDSLEQRLSLLSEGWVPEGYGPAGVAWCN